MTDEWDSANTIIDEKNRPYERADDRVEGDLNPPGFDKYLPDDELYGGSWEEGLQAIEDFAWGNPTSGGYALPLEEGLLEDEENIDWVQQAVDIDREAKAATSHESSVKASPQPVTSRFTLHEIHQSTASSPPIALRPTHDEPEDVEMQDASTRSEAQGASMRNFEAPIIGDSPVGSSLPILVQENATENVMGTTMEDEVIDKQATLPDTSALHSLLEPINTLQDIDAEARERSKKVEEPAKMTNASEELGDLMANLTHENLGTESPPLDGHRPITEKEVVGISSRNIRGPSTQLSSSKDGLPGSTVAPSADDFQNSIHDLGTNARSTSEEAVAEMSVDGSQNTFELLALSASDWLHVSKDEDSAHENTEVDVEDEYRMEAEIPTVSNIFKKLKEASAIPLEYVSNTLPLIHSADATHALVNTGADTIALSTCENVVNTVLSTSRHDGSDVISSANTKDSEDDSVRSPKESSFNKSDTLPVHLQSRDYEYLAKQDNSLLTWIESDTASPIQDVRRPQTQDSTLTLTPSYLGGEIEEMSKTAAARVSLPVSEPSPALIPHLEVTAIQSGRAVEHENDAMITVPPVVTESYSEHSDIASHVSQQALHALHTVDQYPNLYDDRLADANHVAEETKPDSALRLFQSEALKVTTHSTILAVDADKTNLPETKDDENSLAEAPIQDDNGISLVGDMGEMEIDVGIDNKVMFSVNEHDGKMGLDTTTTAVASLQTLPNVPTSPHTPRSSVALVPSTPMSASRFVYLKGSNSFQTAPQDLKRPRTLILKSPLISEKMRKDVNTDSDEEMPPKKKANPGKATSEVGGPTVSVKKDAAKSVSITGGRASANGKMQHVPSDDEVDQFDVEDEGMDVIDVVLHSKKDEKDEKGDLDGFLKYAPSVPQTPEKFQFSASDGLPAHSKDNMGTKLSRGLLAAAAATTLPIKKSGSVTTKPIPNSFGVGTLAPPVKQPSCIPTLETLLLPGKKASLSKSLAHPRTDSNSTNASFAKLLTPWGRPNTRSESKSTPRPNYNLAIEDDLDDEGDVMTLLRPTSVSKTTRAKAPLKTKYQTARKASTAKKPEFRKRSDSKKNRESNVDGSSNFDVEGDAYDNEATEAFPQLASGPEVTNASGNISETDSDTLLVATMFQKSSAKAKGGSTARKPSVSKKSMAYASKDGAACTSKTMPVSKSSTAKHTPTSSIKATEASKTSEKDTLARTAKAIAASEAPAAKAAKLAKAIPPVKSTPPIKLKPPTKSTSTPSTASPARNKYGFTTKTSTRAKTRSQAPPPVAPAIPFQHSPASSTPEKNNRAANAGDTSGDGNMNDKVETDAPKPTETSLRKRTRAVRDEQEKDVDTDPNPPDALSTPGTGTGTVIDFGTKTANANATFGNEPTHTKANVEVPNPTGTPLRERTRAGKAEKEKTKGAIAAPTPSDASSSALETKDAALETGAVTANGASDTASED